MVSLPTAELTEEEKALRKRLLEDPEFLRATLEARAATKPGPERQPRILPDLAQSENK